MCLREQTRSLTSPGRQAVDNTYTTEVNKTECQKDHGEAEQGEGGRQMVQLTSQVRERLSQRTNASDKDLTQLPP